MPYQIYPSLGWTQDGLRSTFFVNCELSDFGRGFLTLWRSRTEILFKVVVWSTRFIHPPSFMESLNHPEDHSDFPHPAVLHPLCAVAGLFVQSIHAPQSSAFTEHHNRLAKVAREAILADSNEEKPAMVAYFQGEQENLTSFRVKLIICRTSHPSLARPFPRSKFTFRYALPSF